MRRLILAAALCASVGLTIQAQAPDPQIVAPITKFIDAFNKGDMAGAAATHAADGDVAIIDEISPFLWRGTKALQTWAADLESDAKKNGITEPKVTVSAPTRVENDGASAYVVVPATYTFKLKGTPMTEAAQMTFSLRKGAGGWLIHGWAWTGPKPQKESAKSK